MQQQTRKRPHRNRTQSSRRKSGEREQAAVSDSSLERMIGVLDLFGDGVNLWTADDMHRRLPYTRSTLYRYLKVLSDAELLTSLPGSGYTLGPRVIELDYEIRRRDPMIVAASPVMQQLAAEVPGIALLCRRYREKVLCTHQAIAPGINIRTTYERGRTLPLFRGAASRIILANMQTPQLKRLHSAARKQFETAELGASFAEVRACLKEIRLQGWDATTGQVTEGITGVAAPIFDRNDAVIGSLSISLREKRIEPPHLKRIAEKVVFGAKIVTKAISG